MTTVSSGPADPATYVDPILSTSDEVSAQLQQAASLMRLTQVRSDPLFAGVDGHGTTVVVIDTGIDLNHPAFGPDANGDGVADRIVHQYDFYGSNDGNASDGNGHGTHVAGIIGSQNATYRGMAPGVSFIVLRVLNDSGSGNLSDIEEALQWVVAHRNEYNIVAVSMSIGDDANVNSDQTNATANEIATLWNAGIAVVVAAGNEYGDTAFTPGVNSLAAVPFAWGVASTLDSGNSFSSFSQRSSTMTEIAAPGSSITSAYPDDSYATASGTSMATPMISGLVALAQDLSQEITGGLRLAPATILSLMRSTGVSITDGTSTVPRVDALNLMNGIVSFYQQSSGNADVIYGWRGNDVLSGLGGDDTIRGNTGDDSIDGGGGNDNAVFAGLRSAYTLTAISGGVRVVGPDGTDTLISIERLVFADMIVSWGAAAIVGDDSPNSLTGTAADDTISGLGGPDSLVGGEGWDLISAAPGTTRSAAMAATTRSPARTATTRSAATTATTSSMAARATTRSGAAPVTTNSAAAPETTSSSAWTATIRSGARTATTLRTAAAATTS